MRNNLRYKNASNYSALHFKGLLEFKKR